MKYIDADKIRAEIERQSKSIENATGDFAEGRRLEQRVILSFLDTLEEPEQPTRGYDEAYLNEKIAKASKSWKGVDVDKFMDEIRGREQPVTDCNDLEEAAKQFVGYDMDRDDLRDYEIGIAAFKAGAEWMMKKMEDEK